MNVDTLYQYKLISKEEMLQTKQGQMYGHHDKMARTKPKYSTTRNTQIKT